MMAEKKVEKKVEKIEKSEKKSEKKDAVKAIYYLGALLTENSDASRDLYNTSRFGDLREDGKVNLSLIEGLYLMEREKVEIFDGKNHRLSYDEYMKKAARRDKNFFIRFSVFKDLRNRGYIVKTALKFGADFRVYDRGVKPGEDHAKWVVFPVHEDNSLTWYEFAAKNRVAHSTKKRLLLGVVDDESDVSYWECRWVRP
jgi:tRNA-intron endonuclease